MVFNFYSPPKNLNIILKGYLEADSTLTKNKTTHTLFPNGYSGIFFNFGNLGRLSIKEEYLTPKVSVFGQIDQCFEAIHWPGSYSLGVLLEPTVLSKLLKVNMSEFTNRTFDGGSILADFSVLHEKLEETKLINAKIDILDRYFTTVLNTINTNASLTENGIRLMHQNTSLSVKGLALQLGTSERYLETQFQKYVGLSPKAYSMIIRFKRMEALLNRNPTISWGQMDFAHEYYDQNHFIKDFKRFTGHTPSDYLLSNFEMGRSYLLR